MPNTGDNLIIAASALSRLANSLFGYSGEFAYIARDTADAPPDGSLAGYYHLLRTLEITHEIAANGRQASWLRVRVAAPYPIERNLYQPPERWTVEWVDIISAGHFVDEQTDRVYLKLSEIVGLVQQPLGISPVPGAVRLAALEGAAIPVTEVLDRYVRANTSVGTDVLLASLQAVVRPRLAGG